MHGPGSRVKKKSSMVGLRLFGYMSQSVLRIQVRKRPLSLSKVAFSSLYEMALPVLKTKIYDHFLIQLYPQLVRKIVTETNYGHSKVVFSALYLREFFVCILFFEQMYFIWIIGLQGTDVIQGTPKLLLRSAGTL